MVKHIYLCGSDGSGKTTLLELLEEELHKRGRITNHIWIRSPKILSKPLMAYCRLTGLTKYFYKNGIRYGSHEFHKSKFVSCLFPYLQYLDMKLVLLFKKQIKGIALYDRYILDTLADLMVDTHRLDLHKKSIGKAFLSLLPEKKSVFFIDVDEDIIRKRKSDTLHDPNISVKIEVYKILARDLGLEIVQNNGDIADTVKLLYEKLDFA